MRNIKILIEAFLSVIFLLLMALPARASSRVETVLPKLLYLPPSENGYQEFVVEEMFPSDCYSPAREDVRIDFIARKVYLADKTIHRKGQDCLTGFTGYLKSIALCRLPAGKYELYFELPVGIPYKVSTFTVLTP